MAPKKHNSRKQSFLKKLPLEESVSDVVEAKGKLSFSFKYFDGSQEAGQDFKDWTEKQKQELLEKLRDYSRESKSYWLSQRAGVRGLKILEIYNSFPRNTDFSYPRHVPCEVKWARFRMESAVRLIGFFIDDTIAAKFNISTDIFYVVFLDKDHRFYKMEKK